MNTTGEIQVIEAFVMSPNPAFIRSIEAMLLEATDDTLENFSIHISTAASIEAPVPEMHVALVDADVIDSMPTLHLGKLKLRLGNVPIVYITDVLKSADALTAVKSLTDDYIFKDKLSALALRNSIRWVLHYADLQLELEQQNHRYESLFYNAVDPSFFLGSDMKISQVNDAFSQCFGTDVDALEGMDFGTLLYDKNDWKNITQNLHSTAKGHVDCEAQFVKLDRKSRFLGHLKMTLLREYTFDGGRSTKVLSGYHGSLSNISYRERLRNAKVRADRVDMTYRLARTLAHEIRNPLTNIHLAIEHIRDVADVDEDTKGLLELIHRSSVRINILIGQLLTASERSKPILNDCALVDLVKEVLEEARDRAALVKASLYTDFAATDITYSCDAQRVKLAISNLVCNAIESLDGAQDGKITVGTYEEDGYLFIYVEDNGIGITDEVKQNLFDPFFTNKDKGLGLGLTSSQTIISEHEGEIEVESAEGYGSTFTISLPLRKNNKE
jgi:PAS domain S-box-containing protein